MTLPEDEEMPYVCPGCHAVGEEPCLPSCDCGWDGADSDEDSISPEPCCDDGGDDVSNAVALLEAALDAERKGPTPPGERCCVVCRELVDGEEHDFCEPEEPTEKMPRVVFDEPPPPARASSKDLIWSDELLCPGCNRWLAFSLVAPPGAIERHLVTSTTATCACSLTATVTYSWRRGAVVALRFARTKAEVLN